jgi:phosphoribosyl-AMP cyclohydrolase
MENRILEEDVQPHLQFEKRGYLLPVIVQEEESKEVLMLGYTNSEAFEKTVNSGLATFWSTSRQQLWTKGETSGDYLHVKSIRVDCDQDALLYLVSLAGNGVCHTRDAEGNTRKSCFYRYYDLKKALLEHLDVNRQIDTNL